MTNADRALAEDMAQETFVKIMHNAASYHPGRPFKLWLYAIATHLVRDHFRRLETRSTEAWDDAFVTGSKKLTKRKL